MKIAVIGGTGLIGSQLVKILNASGHEAVPHSRSTGVDLLTGRGLPGALEGAGVMVNLTKSPTFDEASLAFFQTTTDNFLAAASAAGVGHVVILSIVGADLVPGLVQVLGAALGQRLRLLRENTMVSHRSAACPTTRCNRGLRDRGEDWARWHVGVTCTR